MNSKLTSRTLHETSMVPRLCFPELTPVCILLVRKPTELSWKITTCSCRFLVQRALHKRHRDGGVKQPTSV
eukprot:2275272-Amphidinium_carterae.1